MTIGRDYLHVEVDRSADCPGPKKCHGCACWCAFCDDVTTTCDCARCDRHRCGRCNARLTHDEVVERSDWVAWCSRCVWSDAMERSEARMLSYAEAGDEVGERVLAATLVALRADLEKM